MAARAVPLESVQRFKSEKKLLASPKHYFAKQVMLEVNVPEAWNRKKPPMQLLQQLLTWWDGWCKTQPPQKILENNIVAKFWCPKSQKKYTLWTWSANSHAHTFLSHGSLFLLYFNHWNRVTKCRTEQGTGRIPAPTPNCPSSRALKTSQPAKATSMSQSNQGIHCPGSGYSLTTGPHPALLALECSSEKKLPSECQVPLTRIWRECFEREMSQREVKKKNEKKKKKKKELPHNHHLSSTSLCSNQVNGRDCVTSFIQSAGALTGS